MGWFDSSLVELFSLFASLGLVLLDTIGLALTPTNLNMPLFIVIREQSRCNRVCDQFC